MIKSFHLLQDTQLWDRNPHKQGGTGNILLNHMNLVRPLIPAELANLVIVVTVRLAQVGGNPQSLTCSSILSSNCVC